MVNEILHSKTTQKILEFLCGHPFESFYGVQVALETDLSKGGVNQALRALSKQGLIDAETKGRMTFYKVDLKSPLIKQFKVFHNVAWAQKFIKKITPLSERAVLFGSCASGENTAESDVDIVVIAREGEKAKIRLLLPESKDKRKIQVVVKTPQEFISLEEREPVFYQEIQRGITLWEKGS